MTELTDARPRLSQVMDPPNSRSQKLRFALAPLLQPLLAFFIVTIAVHASSLLAAALAALASSPDMALAFAPLVYILLGATQV